MSICAGSLARTAFVFITGRTKDLPDASRSTRAISAPETSCSSLGPSCVFFSHALALFEERRLSTALRQPKGFCVSSHSENRLKDSASTYLRSAAHQPIDWHEWGA